MDANADLIIDGDAGTQGRFGNTITAGDVNNDGYADVVVSAIYLNNKTGRAYLFYGGDPMDTTVDLTFDGENENDRFGRDINNPKMIGDVNGDGYGDLLISTRTWNFWEGVSGQGRAYLYYGGPETSMDSTCDKIFTGENERDDFGVSGCIFDIDNDGFDDVIIGARRYNDPRGRVYLYWGGQDMDTIADQTFDGEGGSFGCGLDAGYANDDDYGDIIVAAPYYGGKPWSGRAYLFYGDTKARINTICDKTFTLPTDSDNRPQHVAIGDLQNDNYPEVAIGGNYYNNGQGRVWIYYNKPPGSTDEPSISLQEAASAGEVDEVNALISKGVDVNAKEWGSLRTALHYAAEKGHKKVVELLLAKGAKTDARDALSTTPLHPAVEKRHKEVVELLIDKGADANAKDYKGRTPLWYAKRKGYTEIVELLLAKGATVSSIHVAAQMGDLARVKAFIEEGTDVNAKDGNGYTPFHYAIWYSKTDTARLLIEKGADVRAKDQSGYTPLHWAVLMGNKELTELVLDKGADVNARGKAGETPLDFAIYYEAIGQLLVQKGAETASIQSAAFIGDLKKVKGFLDKDVNVNEKKPVRVTALHAAAAGGHKNVAEFLISKGADIDIRTNDGQTALHWAASRSHKDVVELLISKGADVHAKDKRARTPLSLAVQNGHTEIVSLLRKHGAKE